MKEILSRKGEYIVEIPEGYMAHPIKFQERLIIMAIHEDLAKPHLFLNLKEKKWEEPTLEPVK